MGGGKDFRQIPEEPVVVLFRHDEPFGRDADLARIVQPGGKHLGFHFVHIRIIQDDEGIIAPQFQGRRL